MELTEVLRALSALPEKDRKELERVAVESTQDTAFIPNPGKQTQAYFSKADVLLYGGKPGGGKTALEVGLALNEHKRALIVRKNFVDLDGVLHTLDNIVGKVGAATGGNRPKYNKPDGGVIHFMGMGEDLGGKQGNPHDLICVDEAAQLPEHQVRMLMGWLRSEDKSQRCRMVMASNPPLDSTGDWLIEYFAPWLDPQHPDPAQEGELRYFLPNEDGVGYRECGADETVTLHGVLIRAQSRTFISASFEDNPFYDTESYAKNLAGLPDEARGKLLSGSFIMDRSDDAWQVIPTAWVKAAQDRWTEVPPAGVPMCSIGVDVAQGGGDETTLAPRYDGWFAKLIVEPGSKTPTGPDVAGLVISRRRDGAKVIIDVGGGWGADAHGHLKANNVDSEAYMGVKPSVRRTRDKALGFYNLRSQVIWQFREALDPGQEGGSPIMLPRDPKLLADLTAPRYDIDSGKIRVESKEKVIERLGRSTDRGDAVVMAWYGGAKAPDSYSMWRGERGANSVPRVVQGHEARRRR